MTWSLVRMKPPGRMITPDPVPPGPALVCAATVTTDGSPAVATVVTWQAAGGVPAGGLAGAASGGDLLMLTPTATPGARARTVARTTNGSLIRRAARGRRWPVGGDCRSALTFELPDAPRTT